MISDEDRVYIRNMEARTMSAWPSFQTIIDDGWILRFAEGYTKRANSVNPIFQSTDDLLLKIKRCEIKYSRFSLPCIFKLTDIASPKNLESTLIKQGYEKIDETSVQELDIPELNIPESSLHLECKNHLNEIWLQQYCSLNQVRNQNQKKLRRILKSILVKTFYLLLFQDDKCVACGIGVQDEFYIGLFDIVVGKDYRNLGIGSLLIHHILKLGKNCGARKAYLQVMLNNPAALRLYQKLGFKEKYRYWYRKKIAF
ncbi:GNAT family N-acetyltransferase [Promethearchaeum syntrophicum]|uniref:GNAT family N-acetyltransferase n=1 Tax=Promethearchaeum syntrophicum TaxID=2594042 RepID=A0A5B9DG58_9ARCH|nr:GNAT family N-acetyltransferase [Candidatus Prometheoarchaeum syntrophicum]QEE18092.1 ribosomal-protein-alanine N-acetyltransferase [Candidatus Prometheoarchaeum syntrophicum]